MDNAVFILGAGGFIGRRLAESFAGDGVPVVAATRQPQAFDSPLVRNVVASFEDVGQFVQALGGCRVAIHAASASTPGSSEARPQLDGNLRATLALLEAMQDGPSRTLLYLSSGGTLYGDRQGTARETDPLRPRSYHGAGKAAAEHFIHAWAAQYDGSATILRPSNVYGPGQLPRPGFGIVATALDCAMRDRALAIWGDGSAVRDYLYVDDLVTLCRRALAGRSHPGLRTFNASTGYGVSLEALLDCVDAVTGRPLIREYRASRRVDVHGIVPDNTAAVETFDWHPSRDLEPGLRHTWHWFSTHC